MRICCCYLIIRMKTFAVTLVVFFALFLAENLALDAESYIAYIKELSRDGNFVEKYTNWSRELLSQPDYIYGVPQAKFPCLMNKSLDNSNTSKSVHTLRPNDIKCIAAMGDDFTAGLGAQGLTPIDLLFENRGISWSVGGDYSYAQIPTIPNLLREYNLTVKGFSMKGDVMLAHDELPTDSQLNVAKSGARSSDMFSQAERLISLLQNNSLCNWNDDWKMITIFVGTNDLCSSCNENSSTPEQYVENIRLALNRLYNASIPRTLVNLVLPPNVGGFREYNNNSYICQTLLQKICPCAVSSNVNQAKKLDDDVRQYHNLLQNLTSSGRYDGREDFTVVIQPFMAKTQLPYKSNNTNDFSYLSPDCFHFSGKGHSQAAISLWNNMLEPVGMKQDTWNRNGPLKCPTQKYPYIFTSKNSANISDEPEPQTTDSSAIVSNSNSTAVVNTAENSSSVVSNTSTFQITSEEMIDNSNTTSTPNATSKAHRDRKKNQNKKSKSDSSLSRGKLFAIAGFSFIITMILIVGAVRQRKHRQLTSRYKQGNFNPLGEESEEDMDVYTQPTAKSDYSNDKIPTTHGTRMAFD